MKKNLIFESYSDRDEWLQARRKSIGGSDAASIAGLNKFTSPYMTWLEKTDGLEPAEDNEALRQGRDLEGYVAERFTDLTGKEVQNITELIRNPDYPFAHANVDRWIVGENAGLECKTSNTLSVKDLDDGIFPQTYYIQCLHYMAVTGADKFYLAILVFGKAFRVFEIERNEEAISNLMRVEKDFWKLVQDRTPPPVDGTDSTDKALSLQYNVIDENTDLNLFGYDGKVRDYLALKEKKKELETSIKLIEQEIKSELGESETGFTDSYRVTWKKSSRQSFNSRAFIEDHPDMDLSDYYKTSEFRVFKVKESRQ